MNLLIGISIATILVWIKGECHSYQEKKAAKELFEWSIKQEPLVPDVMLNEILKETWNEH